MEIKVNVIRKQNNSAKTKLLRIENTAGSVEGLIITKYNALCCIFLNQENIIKLITCYIFPVFHAKM